MDIQIPSNIQKGILSGKKNKNGLYEKAKIQRLGDAKIGILQVSLFTSKQVFHSNLSDENINNEIIKLLENEFNNLELYTTDFIYGYRITSKGKILSNKRRNNEIIEISSHNKKKNYLLPEGVVVPPLVDLGVMMSDGRIVKSNYDKYKQINRFLEIIDDSIKNENYLRIIDFGCGKSYLTFIIYYYLTIIKNIKCDIIGLDLKEDVIDKCNILADKYNYKNLKFLKGDIAKYSESNSVDMIITLHACDTATDYALYHAIRMKCKYIFSVPCCQHEINAQLNPSILHPINKFGILKERFSAMLTDAIRANILQYSGYKTQVMEFVDLENSPKNLLIRAVYTGSINKMAKEEIDQLINEYNINQTLYNLMFKS